MKFNNLHGLVLSHLRCFSTTIQLQRVATVRTAEATSDELTTKLLTKHRDGNIARIVKLKRVLELDKFGLTLLNEPELTKCLYPTKQARVRLPNGSSSSNRQLEILGKQLLCLQVYQAYLTLFKRSKRDICGYDFNYPSKMEMMSKPKRRPATVILKHLKRVSLVHLARLAVPNNRIPLKKQYAYDQKSFNAIIGYVSLTNNEDKVLVFLKKMIAEKVINTVLLR